MADKTRRYASRHPDDPSRLPNDFEEACARLGSGEARPQHNKTGKPLAWIVGTRRLVMHAAKAHYLASTRSVLQAGRRVHDLVGSERARIDQATAQLERAATEQETRARAIESLMFRDADASAAAATESSATTDGVLAAVLADIEVANVLIAAGHALGESGIAGEKRLLDEALRDLAATTRHLESAPPERLGFEDPPATSPGPASADIESAIATFGARAEQTLSDILRRSEEVTTTVTEALRNIDPQKVGTALASLGAALPQLDSAGRLLRQGITKLERAIAALDRLLKGTPLDKVRADVAGMWEDIKSGEIVTKALGRLLDVEGIRERTKVILAGDGLRRERLDDGATQLSHLATRFDSEMKIAKALAGAVALSATLIGLLQIGGPGVTLLTAFVYALILAVVVTIAMDYTRSGGMVDRVRGVDAIVADLTT
jgi:hypothetical protein